MDVPNGPRDHPSPAETAIRRDSPRGPWGGGEPVAGAAFSWAGVWERQGRSDAWIAQQLLVSVDEVRRRRESARGPDRGSEEPRLAPRRVDRTRHGLGAPKRQRAGARPLWAEVATIREELARASSRTELGDARRAGAVLGTLEELGSPVAATQDERRALPARDDPAERIPSPPAPGPVASLEVVSLGELRRLGLSRTQATRLLRERDRGRVGSVADIASVPGFPKAVRRVLAEALAD